MNRARRFADVMHPQLGGQYPYRDESPAILWGFFTLPFEGSVTASQPSLANGEVHRQTHGAADPGHRFESRLAAGRQCLVEALPAKA